MIAFFLLSSSSLAAFAARAKIAAPSPKPCAPDIDEEEEEDEEDDDEDEEGDEEEEEEGGGRDRASLLS